MGERLSLHGQIILTEIWLNWLKRQYQCHAEWIPYHSILEIVWKLLSGFQEKYSSWLLERIARWPINVLVLSILYHVCFDFLWWIRLITPLLTTKEPYSWESINMFLRVKWEAALLEHGVRNHRTRKYHGMQFKDGAFLFWWLLCYTLHFRKDRRILMRKMSSALWISTFEL